MPDAGSLEIIMVGYFQISMSIKKEFCNKSRHGPALPSIGEKCVSNYCRFQSLPRFAIVRFAIVRFAIVRFAIVRFVLSFC